MQEFRFDDVMSDVPQGTVTFLFTDIVGSTRLWEQFPRQMGPALERHDALLRDAVLGCGGHVFKTVGDAICAAFPTSRPALEAAIEIQRRLAAEDWGEIGGVRVRIGMHTGAAEFRDGDYFGGTLNRVARIEAAAHGGQILLSQVTQGLLEDDPPAEVRFKALGSHRLRNLDRPELLFQVVAPGLAESFPPPRSMEVLPNNLPVQTSSFVGREREIEEVKRRLSSVRLLTLLGSGGTGKTRLALEVGAQVIQAFEDGVWLVELAPLSQPAPILEVVAAALGTREETERPLKQTLIRFLRSKRLLLLLDNCEHLLGAVAELATEFLRACPHLKILATSRHNLGIAGEITFPVPPMAMLDIRSVSLSGPDIVERLSQYEAVKLFIDRASAVRPDFVVTNANAPALAEICSRLDGIPLAIELAAARARVLNLDQIAERLDDRFRLLRTGGTGRMPHQQTLQALIDWSHDLLSEPERILFRRLGAFVGGRTLRALEAVCPGEGIEETEILDLLQQLADKSLITVEREGGGEPRFTLLETVWHYARTKLEASGELDLLRDRHLRYFLEWSESAARKLEGREQKEWLDRCQQEIFNLRFAWDWAIQSGKPEAGYRLLQALYRFLEVRGNLEEAREFVGRLVTVEASTVPPAVAAGFRLAAGRIAWVSDRDDEAQAFYAEAEALYRGAGDEAGAAHCSALRGFLDCVHGRLDEADRRLTEARAVGRRLGVPMLEAMGGIGLGRVAMERGDLDRARELMETGLGIYQRLGDLWTISLVLWGITQVTMAQGDTARATTALGEWGRIARELGNRWAVPFILDRHAELALHMGEPVRSARLFGAADAMREHLGETLSPRDRARREVSIARVRSLLPDPEWVQASQTGRMHSPWMMLEEAARGVDRD